MHPIRARGGKAILRAQRSPLLPPTLGAQAWPSTSPGRESRLLDNGHTPTISLSSPSAIVPIFLPPILGCCKGFAAVCQLCAGLKLLRGTGGEEGSLHLPPRILLPRLATAREGLAQGSVCPPSESVRPPFPGKFANTAVPELGNFCEQGSQGYTERGREREAGGGSSQTKAWTPALDPFTPLQPPS